MVRRGRRRIVGALHFFAVGRAAAELGGAARSAVCVAVGAQRFRFETEGTETPTGIADCVGIKAEAHLKSVVAFRNLPTAVRARSPVRDGETHAPGQPLFTRAMAWK